MHKVEWFLNKSQPDPNGGCWLWAGAMMATGYGAFMLKRKRWLAHRGAWVAANGRDIPDGMMVCHKCDVRACVNPAHLWTGTAQDNFDDAKNKFRLAWQGKKDWSAHRRIRRGQKHPQAKVTDAQVLEICSLDGLFRQEEIALRYGISASHVSEILSGRSRADVPGRVVDSRHRNNALTVHQVSAAKAMRREGLTFQVIADAFDVSKTTILRAVRGYH